MSVPKFSRDDLVGFEPKHITYVKDQEGRSHDLLVAKVVAHLKDGQRIPMLRYFEDYKRPFWITKKGLRNHKEKKDYELVRNLEKYSSTQVDLVRSMGKALGEWVGPRTTQRELQRSPYIYGSDVSSACCLKADFKRKYPGLMSLNTVAGGDIETSVTERTEHIICMSVSHKSNVRLVYLKDWVSDIADPVGETLKKAQELIPEIIAGRKLNIEVLVVDTPGQVALKCLEKLHEWKPDFFSFWNIDFDMPKIIRALEKEGISLSSVFSDPSVPENYRYFEYRRGPTQKVTASGKVMSLSIEDRWNWVTHPASFQCIDAMTVYRITRLAAGKDPSYALDNILKKELNGGYKSKIKAPGDIQAFIDKAQDTVRGKGGFVYYYINDELVDNFHHDLVKIGDTCEVKLDFGKLKTRETEKYTGIRWHEIMQTRYKIEYGVYNIVDSIRLEQLDEKTKDLASSITSYSKNSDYKNFNSNPKRLTDDMHYWYLNRPEPAVIGTGSDQMSHELDKWVVGTSDWIITLPSYMVAPDGVSCVKDFPNYKTLIFPHTADLDLVSTYPTASQILNIARETCVMEFSMMEGITEHHRREVGVNLTAGRGNSIEITQKILGAPTMDSLLEEFINSTKKHATDSSVLAGMKSQPAAIDASLL